MRKGFLYPTIFILFASLALVGCASKVPELQGLDRSEASAALADSGIKATFSQDHHSTIPEGHVIRSYPREGESVARDDELKVVLSKGKKRDRTAEFAEEVDALLDELSEEWWPAGFVSASRDIAAKWVTERVPDPCGYGACTYWGIEIVSRNGCLNGVYLEIDILRNGTVVDWTNETVSSLRTGERAEVVFTKRGLASESYEARLSEVNCR